MKAFVIAIGLIGVASPAIANYHSKENLYAKCYAKLTDHPVEYASADYKAVVAGKLDPIKACLKVLDSAFFVKSSGGKVRKLKKTGDPIARGILRNFHQFHLSWFSEPYNNYRGFFSLVDHTEPALFLTDALFSKKHYKTIVTAKTPLRGVRNAGQANPYYLFTSNIQNLNFVMGPVSSKDHNFNTLPNKPRVPVGFLLGVQDAPRIVIPLTPSFGRDKLDKRLYASRIKKGDRTNFTEHYGGGVLGSPAFLINNMENNGNLDGGERINRRWANNSFYDIMCLTLPTLRDTDVTGEMNRYKGSQLSFRTDRSCQRCHATLDNMADASKNIEMAVTASGTFLRILRDKYKGQAFTNHRVMYKHNVALTMNEKVPIGKNKDICEKDLDSDRCYSRRPAVGKLFYRDYKGRLVNQSVNGIQDLGNKISRRDDIYMCAAKRYYEFLTGVNIPIQNANTSDKFVKHHYNQIIKLGTNLKKNGSLRNLIEGILKTPAFKALDPKTVAGEIYEE